MVISSKKTYENLKKKGFHDVAGDHKFLRFFHNGKLVLPTKTSHGSAHDLNDYLIGQMAHQCKLDKKDFFSLVNCPLSAEDYLNKLIAAGITE